MTGFSRMPLVIAIAFSTIACATMQVGSHVERGNTFTQYRTFDWGPRDTLPASDPRLDRDPVFHDYMQGAVEKALAARGFARVDTSAADLKIHYHASVTRRIDVNRIDRERGYVFGEGSETPVFDYEAGFLILDVIDARTNRLIWRGWARDDFEKFIGSDRMVREITEAVRRMVAQLPRSL